MGSSGGRWRLKLWGRGELGGCEGDPNGAGRWCSRSGRLAQRPPRVPLHFPRPQPCARRVLRAVLARRAITSAARGARVLRRQPAPSSCLLACSGTGAPWRELPLRVSLAALPRERWQHKQAALQPQRLRGASQPERMLADAVWVWRELRVHLGARGRHRRSPGNAPGKPQSQRHSGGECHVSLYSVAPRQEVQRRAAKQYLRGPAYRDGADGAPARGASHCCHGEEANPPRLAAVPRADTLGRSGHLWFAHAQREAHSPQTNRACGPQARQRLLRC
mmetsp:Transcript_33490/g.106178  ORF Transcript_33490/g.106178 Transcript_33490/m.106178 type:complete len:277 (-) Transcript_33490:718-1548(-)